MKKAFVLLILITLFYSCKRTPIKNSLFIENLFGDVKEMTEYSYNTYIDSNNAYSKGALNFKTIYRFDEKGFLTEWIEYNANGGMEWKAIPTKDNSGMQTGIIAYKSNSVLSWKAAYVYDNNGNKSEETDYDAMGNIESKITFKYDKNNKKSERIIFSPSGAISSKSVFINNEKGNEIGNEYYDANGTLKAKCTIQYFELDKINNWHKQIQLLEGRPALIIEREIEYYSK